MAPQVIAEIGGTGTQGGGVVEALLKFGGYAVPIPGHEPASDAVKALARRRIDVVILALLIAIFARGTVATAGDQKASDPASDIALARKHFKAVNETDPQKRKVLFREVYDPNVHFASPRGVVDGRTELEQLFADIHMKSPGVVFQDIGDIEAHHGIARIHWAAVKSGVSDGLTADDFIKIKDGKVTEVYIIVNGWTKSGVN